MQNTNV